MKSVALTLALLLVAAVAQPQNVQPGTRPKRIRVAADVAADMLVHQVLPVYPMIAQTAHIQGTVIFHAIIAQDGSVKELQYLSGPPIFMQAARDAVEQWKYKPFLLNGQPLEVDTTIPVVFGFGGTDAASTLAQKPKLAAKIQGLLPSNIEVFRAAAGYFDVQDFASAVCAAHDLNIPFAELRCVELGGRSCEPPTNKNAMSLEKAIHALKPEMSKEDVKNAEKKAKAEAKALK